MRIIPLRLKGSICARACARPAGALACARVARRGRAAPGGQPEADPDGSGRLGSSPVGWTGRGSSELGRQKELEGRWCDRGWRGGSPRHSRSRGWPRGIGSGEESASFGRSVAAPARREANTRASREAQGLLRGREEGVEGSFGQRCGVEGGLVAAGPACCCPGRHPRRAPGGPGAPGG